MSERVEREFKEWQGKYEIPYLMEFQVKTLLKLQEEYDNIFPAENNTKRRESLLKMINEAWRSLYGLKEKQKYALYFDIKRNDDGSANAIVYKKDSLYTIHNKKADEIADYILRLSSGEYEIYGDCNGFGVAIYDSLISKGVEVHKLKILPQFRNNK